MEKKKTILDYIAQILTMFGFMMTFMMGLCLIFGESAKGVSSFWALGRAGVPVNTMVQFLLLSVIIVLLRCLFFTDRWIKKMSVMGRTIAMILTIILTISAFIVKFDWFPVNMWQPWAMFFLCFGICFCASTLVVGMKNRMENKKLEEGLSRMKQQWEEQDERADK